MKTSQKSSTFASWGFDRLRRACLTHAVNHQNSARMSENENQPPSPSKQTSSVPLKKETVRVTLKAADAPAVPSSTVPLAPPVRPPVPPGAPRPPTASTAMPPRPAGAPAAAPAPTIRLATSTAPIRAGAPTVALKTPGSTPTLPKATVQLQPPTSPLGASSPSQAPTLMVADEEEEQTEDTLTKILSGVGLAVAILLLTLQLVLASKWISAEDNPRTGDWSQLIE